MRKALTRHVATSLVVLVVAGVGAAVLVSRVVAEQVQSDAMSESRQFAQEVVSPLVDARVRDGDPAALAALDAAARARTRGSTMLRTKVWDADGRIIYSDAPGLIGRRYPLDGGELEALRGGGGEAEISDVTRPENVFERGIAPAIEVYNGVRDATGRRVLVEVYFSAANLHHQEIVLSTKLTAVALLALVFLALTLFPLSLQLARRVERYERERLAMLRLAVDASADERRRLAQELHDGVVQDLSGTRYVLAAVEKQLSDKDLPDLRGNVRVALDVILVQIEALRSLTSALFSAAPGGTDVTEVLKGLAQDAEARGLKVHLDIGALPPLPATVAESITQVAREALRNVVSHAGASLATVTLRAEGDEVLLVVSDNGRGFRPGQAAVPRGHLGLQLLEASAQRASGTLTITSEPAVGTHVRLAIPVRRDGMELSTATSETAQSAVPDARSTSTVF